MYLMGALIVILVDLSVDASVDMSVATRLSINRVSVDTQPTVVLVSVEYGHVSVYTLADMCQPICL